LPPSDPVAKNVWNEFAAVRDHALAEMPPPPGEHPTLADNQPPAANSTAR